MHKFKVFATALAFPLLFISGCQSGPSSRPFVARDGYELITPVKMNKPEPLEVDTKNGLVGGNYIVMLINSSDHVVRMVKVDNGPWQHTQEIRRTCESLDYTYCAERQKYQPLVAVDCGKQIKVTVAWREPDTDQGKWFGADWQPFLADCAFKGGIIQLTP